MNRFLLYLYGRRNIAGCVGALVGLGLLFAGIIKSYWFPITLGLYAIGALLMPSKRSPGLALSADLTDEQIEQELDRVVAIARKDAGPEIGAKVESIRDSVRQILPKTDGAGGLDENVYLVRQTVYDYLPRALNSYLSLPRTYANRQKLANGKTPYQLLNEQLELLDDEMRKIADAVNAADAQQLVVHGQFLKEQFGTNTPKLLEIAAKK